MKASSLIRYLAEHIYDHGDVEVVPVVHFWDKDDNQYRSIGPEDLDTCWNSIAGAIYLESHYYEDENSTKEGT